MPIQQYVGCTPWDPEKGNEYGYPPHLAPGIAFVTLFSLSTILHVIQASWKRQWWCMLFTLGALTEAIGWDGRTWSSQCPSNLNAFLIQITTLIIECTFGFCSCDILSLVIQAVGGGMASTAVAANPPKQSKSGTNIMVGGYIFQMATITIFVFFFIDFLRRVRHDRHNAMSRKIWCLVFASAFSCLMIYIRSIYRTVELLQGWSGYLITHENFFIALDASLMLGAVVVFNFTHPGWFLPTQKETALTPPKEFDVMYGQKERADENL